MKPILLSILSDLFVNLSAGWFGAAFIVPITTKKSKIRWWILTVNIAYGILTLVISLILRYEYEK